MSVVYLNIGSNLGNRKALLLKAIESIGDIFSPYCLSGFVESDPWGFVSANPFLNVGMAFKSSLHPENILKFLKKIEKEISSGNHRDANGNYCDREIDIDIMAIDEMKYESPTLVIPHRHLLERDFFFNPLHELNPGWKYPQ